MAYTTQTDVFTDDVLTAAYLNQARDNDEYLKGVADSDVPEKILWTADEVNISNSTTETTIVTSTITGGSLDSDNFIEFEVWLKYYNESGASKTVNYNIKYGASTVLTYADAMNTSSDPQYGRFHGFLRADGGTAAQEAYIIVERGTTGGQIQRFSQGTSAEDASGDLDFTITAQCTTAHANLTWDATLIKATLY